jgi:hypothetical protein
MNPLNVEKCMAAYLEGVTGIASVIPVHESISAEDVDLNKSAIVVEAESTEHTSGNLYLATVNVSLRSPALSVSQSDHLARWTLVANALENQTNMATSFASTISTGSLGIVFNGRYVRSLSTSTSDRAWVNAADLAVGIGTV